MKNTYFLVVIICCTLSGCNSPKGDTTQVETVPIKDLQVSEIRHDTLSKIQLDRIKKVSETLQEVSLQPYSEWIDNFKRDKHPDAEIEVWEAIASAYTGFQQKKSLTIEQKRELFQVLLFRSMAPAQEVLQQVKLESLTKEEAIIAMKGYGKKEQPITVEKK